MNEGIILRVLLSIYNRFNAMLCDRVACVPYISISRIIIFKKVYRYPHEQFKLSFNTHPLEVHVFQNLVTLELN